MGVSGIDSPTVEITALPKGRSSGSNVFAAIKALLMIPPGESNPLPMTLPGLRIPAGSACALNALRTLSRFLPRILAAIWV